MYTVHEKILNGEPKGDGGYRRTAILNGGQGSPQALPLSKMFRENALRVHEGKSFQQRESRCKCPEAGVSWAHSGHRRLQ